MSDVKIKSLNFRDNVYCPCGEKASNIITYRNSNRVTCSIHRCRKCTTPYMEGGHYEGFDNVEEETQLVEKKRDSKAVCRFCKHIGTDRVIHIKEDIKLCRLCYSKLYWELFFGVS